MRRLRLGSVVLCLILVLSGVGMAANPKVRIVSAPVLSVLPFYWMQETGALPNVDLEISLSSDHTRNLNLVATGQSEYLVTGLNVGAKAYGKGLPIQLVNVAAWQLDYIVVRDSSISNWADLVGKRINIPLQGGPVDFLFMYLIQKEGLKPSQFTFVYAPPVQAVQLLQLGQIDAAVLPEPQVTMVLNANPNARIAIDVQKEWAKWHRGEADIPYVALFINKNWADANPALAKQIAQAYNEGVKWMNDNPKAAAALGSRALGVQEQVLLQGTDRARLTVYDYAKTKALVDEHLTEMWQFNSDLVGDKVPDAGFYRP